MTTDTNLNSIEAEMRKKETTRKYIIQLFNNFKQDIQGTPTVKYLMKKKYYLIKELLSICDNGYVCSFDHPGDVEKAKNNLLLACSKCYEDSNDLSLVDTECIMKLNKTIDTCIKNTGRVFNVSSGKDLILELLNNYYYLPTTCEFCYYCIKNKIFMNKDACLTCEYAKVHKSCMDNTSDYVMMINELTKLINIIKIEERYNQNDKLV